MSIKTGMKTKSLLSALIMAMASTASAGDMTNKGMGMAEKMDSPKNEAMMPMHKDKMAGDMKPMESQTTMDSKNMETDTMSSMKTEGMDDVNQMEPTAAGDDQDMKMDNMDKMQKKGMDAAKDMSSGMKDKM